MQSTTSFAALTASLLFLLSTCGGTTSDDSAGKAGASTGGATTGGTGGVAATGDGSGTGASPGTGGSAGNSYAECQQAEECSLFRDCCTCTAYGKNEDPPPSCLSICEADACTAWGLAENHEPACAVGQCVAGFDCDPSHAACESLPPSCAPGTTVAVANGCWAGCVPSAECAYVPGCDACGAERLCVNQNYYQFEFHCVRYPEQCGPNPKADCLCPIVCPSWNFCSSPSSGYVQCDYI